MTSILNSLMSGGYVEDNTDFNLCDEETMFPDVPLYCCTKMDPSILAKMHFEASKRDPDGGIPGKAPYVITKTGWWPLGFGDIEPISDEHAEGDWEYVVHPDDSYKVSLSDYSKTWVMYVGPEDEPFWSAIAEFQKCPLVDIPDDPCEDQRKERDEAQAEPAGFMAIETDELPF